MIQVRGVNYHKTRKHWTARVTKDGRTYFVGEFATQYRAARALRSFKRKLQNG